MRGSEERRWRSKGGWTDKYEDFLLLGTKGVGEYAAKLMYFELHIFRTLPLLHRLDEYHVR
jgi:hypothetical protein